MEKTNVKAQSIDIVFENCEVITCAPGDEVSVTVRSVEPLDILENPDHKIYRSSVDELVVRIRPHMKELIDRVMQYSDITWAYVKFSDGMEIAFCAPWEDTQKESNTYETHHFEPDGTLLVTIKKGSNDMKKYVCPFCGKEYDSTDEFAACVARCHANDQSSKAEAAAAQRNADFNAVCDAYKQADKLRDEFEKKYHAKVMCGVADFLRLFK